MHSPQNRPLATCAKGLEGLLLEELRTLGGTEPSETVGGVYFTADQQTLYRICLWSRLASRVLAWITTVPALSAEELYEGVKEVDWADHLDLDSTFAIAFQGTSRAFQHTNFGALKAKDAIADWFVARHGKRPSVSPRRPDLPLHIRLRRGEATVRVDLSGEALHRRGYRQAGGEAPLKENLAAALLLRANWPAIASDGGALIDPMCGSATILTEAAWMALDRAPGLNRDYWGFSGWLGHVPSYWNTLIAEAKERAAKAGTAPDIYGYDGDLRAVRAAEKNIEAAGLTGVVHVRYRDLSALAIPTHKPVTPGLIITNPPYGERLSDSETLRPLYRALGDRFRSEFQGWRAAVFTGNPDLGKTMGLRAERRYQLFNGSIPSQLLLFDVDQDAFVDAPPPDALAAIDRTGPAIEAPEEAQLGNGASMLANRLRKNLKSLRRWRRQNQIESFRVYDADMPEYAVAIDCYADQVHVAEYKAPATVSADAAARRFDEVLDACAVVFEKPRQAIAVKQRARQRGRHGTEGKGQYQRLDSQGAMVTVNEGQARLLVNLTDYLDTGLFLDHRKVRMHIATLARGSRFLNLFCYTGAATVHAALGGARFSTSVDLSGTYLDWARKNFAANGLSEQRHRLERADVMSWLEQNDQTFDLIFVDPPTYSNSKSIDADFDIQRDHVRVLKTCAQHLTDDGVLIFSNNSHKFELAPELHGTFKIEDRTAWSREPDFERARHRRHCWFMRPVLPRTQQRARPARTTKPASPWAGAAVRQPQPNKPGKPRMP